MLIKSADNKTKDIETLQGLLTHPAANADAKRKIEQEIKFIQSGAKGERDAAYEIDFHYGPSKNWAVVHDLRIEHGGRVAQIDHILVNRFLDVWVCESKRFGEGIAINEHGECSAFFNGKPYGLPSPFEQNRKHCAVLKAMFDDGVVELPKRLGFSIKPDIKSLVLVSKNARITRPKAKTEGMDDILKADQIKARIEKEFDNDNNILTAAKIVGSDTLKDFAARLAAMHVPASFDWHAKFGLPKQTATPARPADKATAPAPAVADKAAEESKKKSKLACSSCGETVAYNVAKFCWFNKAKFEGNVYCMDCQKKLPAAD
ncbi:MAG: NERD domain-containing protein [Rhodocyclales bacterium]|nr:NERD domain-containing protein [Rhodocyclales bacterium]